MINKHIKIVLMLAFIALIIVALGCAAFAHSGGTDSNGGHTNHTTGEYHYHHGYPAHQHNADGSCPYRNNNSASSSSALNDPLTIVLSIFSCLTLLSMFVNIFVKEFKIAHDIVYAIGAISFIGCIVCIIIYACID